MKETTPEERKQMRQRQATFAVFEREILDLYEQQMLTSGLLDHIASQYQPLAIDCTGSQSLLTQDGKDICQICIELIDPTFPLIVRGSSEDHDEYWEQELQKWEEIMYVRWRWERQRTGFSLQCQQDDAA